MEDTKAPLNQALEDCKQQALSEFVKQMMPLLEQHSWRIENLLEALAEYCFLRSDWSVAVKHLEDAAHEIRTRRI